MDTTDISTIDEVLKIIPRFRILCAGRAGVGKSSLVNCVFGITEAKVSRYMPGEASIDQEFVSDENPYFVLHNSKGFEAGDDANFKLVDRFLGERHAKPDLKDKLHAIWLCTETPRAGGRVLEEGDKKLLLLAHKLNTPIVVVFTKYDKLVRSKEFEQEEDNPEMDPKMLHEAAKADASNAFNASARALPDSAAALHIPTPPYINVSVNKGYETTITRLVDMTCKIVHKQFKDDAWVTWAVAPGASLPMKIKVCIEKGFNSYHRALAATIPGVGKMLLRECLAQVHQDIITCWNFKDRDKILSGEEFKHLMLYLVQDVFQSQSPPTHVPRFDTIAKFIGLVTASTIPVVPPVAVLGLEDSFVEWLSSAVLKRTPKVQCLLMTYAIDLISVLTSLFNFTLKLGPPVAGTTDWKVLQKAFEYYGYSARRKEIHAYCRTLYESNGPVLKRGGFRRTIQRLLDESMESHSKQEEIEEVVIYPVIIHLDLT